MVQLKLKNWWIEALKGIVAVIIGIVAFSNPAGALHAIAVLFAIFAIVAGMMVVIVSWSNKGKYWKFWIGEGIFDMIIGILILANPGISISVFVVFIALFIIAVGIIQLLSYYRLKNTLAKPGIYLLTAVISLLFGILLLFNPFEGVKIITVILGIYAVIYGVSSLYLSFKLSGTR